jgi:hypothetical protein
VADSVNVLAWKKLACAVILQAVRDVAHPVYCRDAIAFLSSKDSIWHAFIGLDGKKIPDWDTLKSRRQIGRIEPGGRKAVAHYAAGAR